MLGRGAVGWIWLDRPDRYHAFNKVMCDELSGLWRTLRTDDSAGDVAEALAALQRGDTKLASAAYERVIDRWRIAYSVESSN